MYQGLRNKRIHRLLTAVWCVLCLQGAAEASPIKNPRLGLPPVVVPRDNPMTAAKIQLGKTLFFDKHLSGNGKVSCSSCHQPIHAFTDGKPIAQGINKQLGTRNTPTILNAAYYTTFFWDGRRKSLEAQALDPFHNPHEQGLKNLNALLRRIRQNPRYLKTFRKAFGPAAPVISTKHVGQAIASFERTLIRGDSPFDRYYYGHEKHSLSPAAIYGLALFTGRAHCSSCHTIGKHYAIFTDNKFHRLGVGFRQISKNLAAITTRLVEAHKRKESLDHTVLSDKDISALGRFAVTMKPSDIGKFRTPSLRNVAVTGPYMHNGSVKTLKQAIEREIYYRSAKNGRPLILTPIEKADLLAFLKSLTSANAITKTVTHKHHTHSTLALRKTH